MVIRDGHGRLVLLVHRAKADPEEDGGGHHRRKRETEGVVHEVELASSHFEHDGFLRALGLLGASSAIRFARGDAKNSKTNEAWKFCLRVSSERA